MKNFLLLSLMLLASGASAQDLQFDSLTQKFMYRGIVQVDSATAAQLFERGRQWIAIKYRSANDVVQYESKEEGKIIAKGRWVEKYSELQGFLRGHTLILEFKENRVRYTFTDFEKFFTKPQTLGQTSQTLESIKFMKKDERAAFAKVAQTSAADLETSLKSAKKDGW